MQRASYLQIDPVTSSVMGNIHFPFNLVLPFTLNTLFVPEIDHLPPLK